MNGAPPIGLTNPLYPPIIPQGTAGITGPTGSTGSGPTTGSTGSGPCTGSGYIYVDPTETGKPGDTGAGSGSGGLFDFVPPFRFRFRNPSSPF